MKQITPSEAVLEALSTYARVVKGVQKAAMACEAIRRMGEVPQIAIDLNSTSLDEQANLRHRIRNEQYWTKRKKH